MAIDPWAGANQGIANYTNSMMQLAQLKRQDAQDAQRSSLLDLQREQTQQGIDQNKITLADLGAKQNAMVDQYGTAQHSDPLASAYSFQAQQGQEAEQQKAAREKQKYAFDEFTKVAKAVDDGLIDPKAATDYYRHAMKLNGLDLESAGVNLEFQKQKGGYFSGPVAPDSLFMINGKPTPYGGTGTITKARIVGQDPQSGKPIFEMDENTTFAEAKPDHSAYKFRTRTLGNQTVDEESQDGGRTWTKVGGGPRYKPATGGGNGAGGNGGGGGGGGKPPKPLPPTALKLQDEHVQAIGTSASLNKDLDGILTQLDTGDLNLGMVDNAESWVRNATGFSSKNSRNFSTFRANLEKLRNDSLKLNKGVQTEGDAQRAWNEILTNLTDEELVKQRLAEVKEINDRAVTLRTEAANLIRSNYGQGPLDTANLTNVKGATNLNGKGGGKTIDKVTAQRFLRQAGGNKDKARELAKKAGYSF